MENNPKDRPERSRVVVFSTDPWDSSLPVLRLRGPLQAAGYQLIQGKEGAAIYPERVNDADVVVIQRDFPQFWDACSVIIESARSQGKPVVYELDDLIFELPRSHPLWDNYSDILFTVFRGATQADLITVSTPYLADYFRPFHPNVVVLPNTLDGTLWVFNGLEVAPTPERAVEIGYMGSATHQSDLEIVVPVLKDLLDQYGNKIKLKFCFRLQI